MGPRRFATENYCSQTSRLILIIITSLGLNIFSHERSVLADWFTGTLRVRMRKIPYPFSAMGPMKFLRELHIFVENETVVGEEIITD